MVKKIAVAQRAAVTLAFMTVLFTAAIAAQPASTVALFPVHRGSKFGYIDREGKIVIPLQFDQARALKEGLGAVRIGANWGFIDAKGATVIAPMFESAESFSEGLAAVKIKGKNRYVDRLGKLVISPQFDSAYEFSSGRAAVKVGEKWGYIDQAGKLVIPIQFDAAHTFSEGLAAVDIGSKKGYIDAIGKVVIEPQFIHAERFSDGLAMTMTFGDHQVNFIDNSGRVVVRMGAQELTAVSPLGLFFGGMVFSEGVASNPVGAKWGYVDRAGKSIIPPKFVLVSPFSEGLAAVAVVKSNSAIWGYINHEGKMVIEPKFKSAGKFENGLASVSIGDQDAYIDSSGKFVWGPSK